MSVTTEQMIRWGVCAEDLDDLARRTSTIRRPELSVQVVESKEGGKAAILSSNKTGTTPPSAPHQPPPPPGTATRRRLPGRDAGPDMLIAMTRGRSPSSTDSRPRPARLQPPPLPDHRGLFFVTRDGVAGTELSEGSAEAA